MIRHRAAAVFLCAAALAAQRPGANVVEGDVGRRLDAAVQQTAKNLRGAVLVAQHGKVLLARGYGKADLARVPVTAHALFDLGTLTTQVTELAALQLVRDKKLRLEVPLARVFQDWPEDKAGITVEHLFRHTSGMPPDATWGGGTAGAVRTAVATIARSKLVDAPGKAVHWSVCDSGLLGLLVEQTVGGSYERFCVEHVLAKAGATGAAFCDDRGVPEAHLTLRQAGKNKPVPATEYDLNWAHRGTRGLLASVADVHVLLQALLAGRLVDAAGLELLWAPVDGGGAYRVRTVTVDGQELLELTGATEGYRARVGVHRKAQSWFVLLGDENLPADALQTALLAALPGGLAGETAPGAAATPAPAANPAPSPTPTTPAAPAAPLPPGALERFVGRFEVPGDGWFDASLDNGALVLAGSGLQASARLRHGQWPPPPAVEAALRSAEDKGLALLQAIVDEDPQAFGRAFADDDAARAGRQAWDAWVAAHGKATRVRWVGAELEPRAAWFAVRFGAHELVLQAALAADGRLQKLAAAATGSPFRLALQMVRADVALGKTPGGQPIVVTVEGLGDGRRLVFEDASAGSAGLLDCPMAAAASRR